MASGNILYTWYAQICARTIYLDKAHYKFNQQFLCRIFMRWDSKIGQVVGQAVVFLWGTPIIPKDGVKTIKINKFKRDEKPLLMFYSDNVYKFPLITENCKNSKFYKITIDCCRVTPIWPPLGSFMHIKYSI